jgi:stalled ribosome rescue protein Dom34
MTTTPKNAHIFMDHSTAKNLGIWMDHANAHLMEFTTDPITTNIVSSKFTHREKEQSLGKSENGMHQKEQHEQSGYYKKLADVIRNYQNVVLFGPTTAKVELLNIIRADHQFEHIEIDVRDSDKMTQNEQHAFVRTYFENR